MRVHIVGGKPLAQRLEDRDAARDRGLEGERHALVLGEPRQRRAVMSDERLVGGDDMLAVGAARR